jgi:hypothetical protein
VSGSIATGSRSETKEAVMILAEHSSWHCRVCGAGRGLGNAHVVELDPTEAWVAAGNRVQWRTTP